MGKWKQTNERAIRSEEVVVQVATRTRYRPRRTLEHGLR